MVKGITPKQTGCGLVYDLPNPIERSSESFAIADMRKLKVTEPHYHANGEIEIYIVLQGYGSVVIGYKTQQLKKDSVVIIPTNTGHFTLPTKDLVLAVINTPPFNVKNYIALEETNAKVCFDKDQFENQSTVL